MLRPFVSQFLLPLVRGGELRVGRPLGRRSVEALASAWSAPEGTRKALLVDVWEKKAAGELAVARAARARVLLPDARGPALDETTLRLGAAAHDILALAHPDLDRGPGDDRARARIAEAALALADVGPPQTALEAVARHSLLGRLPEIVQIERLVSYWLGRRRYVGQTPPAGMLVFPALRRVRQEEVRRSWMREVGVPAGARLAWIALQRASPLGEALDPLRLDPALGWERLGPVLRSPSLARLVAGRVLELGLPEAGGALATAFLRHASLRDPGTGAAPGAAEIALGVRFLAHLAWLDLLCGRGSLDGEAGDLGALLAAALEVEPGLVYPGDVPRGSTLGQTFSAALVRWRGTARARSPERFEAALDVCRRAISVTAIAHPS
jgi:hypothetical protein